MYFLSTISPLDSATRASISKGGKVAPDAGSAFGVSSLPPQPSAWQKIVKRLPKSLQQFVKSVQRKFGKNKDEDDFKNLSVNSPDLKASVDSKGKKTDLKGKLVGALNRKMSTMDTIKVADKNAKPAAKDAKKGVDAASQAKSKLPDNTKQVQAQQQQQTSVDSKTQNLAINAKQPAAKKEDKDKEPKRKKESTPVQPVIQVPGTVPPPEANRKSKNEKKSKNKGGKKKKPKSEDEDDDDDESNEDIDEEAEDEDNDDDEEKDDDEENDDETEKDSEEDEEATVEVNESADEEVESNSDKKKKKAPKKSNSKQKPKKKKK